jgi:signal transduction histidine kinase
MVIATQLGRVVMLYRVLLTGVFVVMFSAVAFAAPSYGTAEEARAMLERAVAAVKQDKAKALEMFNEENGEFRDRDLYVFCANESDGIETAHPTHKGFKLSEMKDANGFAFGKEIMRTAEAGKISEVAYMWPRPGSDTPVQKISYVTKVTDQICGVGYYE